MLNSLDPMQLLTETVARLSARVKHLESLPILTRAYPFRATMWHHESDIVTGNALTSAANTAQLFNVLSHQNAAANGDEFTNGFPLAAGDYTLYVLGESGSDRGKIDWYLDDVLQLSGQDWYSAGTTSNVIKNGSITVVGNKAHVLRGVINGKNASSSNYTMKLTKMWIAPATDTVS